MNREARLKNQPVEAKDFSLKTIGAMAGTILGLILVAFVLTAGLYRAFHDRRLSSDPRPYFTEPKRPPPPRLQESPSADMAKFRQEQETFLNSYGWVDKKQGRVRIPIERAMEIVIKEGLSARKQ